MPPPLLFLFGGSPAYGVYADEFVSAAWGRDGRLVALVQSGEGWEKYQAEIPTHGPKGA
jgi:hypothetical protein